MKKNGHAPNGRSIEALFLVDPFFSLWADATPCYSRAASLVHKQTPGRNREMPLCMQTFGAMASTRKTSTRFHFFHWPSFCLLTIESFVTSSKRNEWR